MRYYAIGFSSHTSAQYQYTLCTTQQSRVLSANNVLTCGVGGRIDHIAAVGIICDEVLASRPVHPQDGIVAIHFDKANLQQQRQQQLSNTHDSSAKTAQAPAASQLEQLQPKTFHPSADVWVQPVLGGDPAILQ